MDILRDRLEDVKRYDPTRQIIIIWDIRDVQSVRPDLTDEQANEVLQKMKIYHDAHQGINWDTIEYTAEQLYPVDEIPEEYYIPKF